MPASHASRQLTLGVFDSGIGGLAITKSLQDYFPAAQITTVNDSANLPYGSKSSAEIRRLTNAAIQPLLGLDIIVIACNSATTAAIDWLRQTYPNQKFIGIEPMIKPATQLTASRVIGVCATPATLASSAYQRLIDSYATGLTVIEPDCSDWASMIEQSAIDEASIRQRLDEMINRGADVIVLGCTHYHWIKQYITEYVGPDITVLEPSSAIGRRIANLLAA